MESRWQLINCREDLGDYWRVIICGISLGRDGDQLKIERVGPAVPAVSVIAFEFMLVTESFSSYLKALSGIEKLQPVKIEKCVRLEWESIDLVPDSRHFIKYGETEDIIEDGTHDDSALKQMGPLYEAVLKTDGVIREDYDRNGNLVVKFIKNPSGKHSIFSATTEGGNGSVVVDSSVAASWPPNAKKWLQFTDIKPSRRGQSK